MRREVKPKTHGPTQSRPLCWFIDTPVPYWDVTSNLQ